MRTTPDPASQQEPFAVVCVPGADGNMAEIGLVDDGNFLEWEIIIIGSVLTAAYD